MKNTSKTFLIIGLIIALIFGTYSLVYIGTYRKYRQEKFQMDIVESLGLQNENRKFIMADANLSRQSEFSLSIAIEQDGDIRSIVCDYKSQETYLFFYTNGVMTIQFNGQVIVSKNVNEKEFFDEIVLFDLDWSKSSSDVTINHFILNKNKNSAKVKFVFEKDYKVILQIPILDKIYTIEDFYIHYDLMLESNDGKDYTWPTVFFLNGKVDGEIFTAYYVQ